MLSTVFFLFVQVPPLAVYHCTNKNFLMLETVVRNKPHTKLFVTCLNAAKLNKNNYNYN